jgi:hypothetical protein
MLKGSGRPPPDRPAPPRRIGACVFFMTGLAKYRPPYHASQVSLWRRCLLPDSRRRASMQRGYRMGKPNRWFWSMKSDRELIQLAKTRTLQAIADQLQRSPAYILKRAARLGLSIKDRKAKGK